MSVLVWVLIGVGILAAVVCVFLVAGGLALLKELEREDEIL